MPYDHASEEIRELYGKYYELDELGKRKAELKYHEGQLAILNKRYRVQKLSIMLLTVNS